MKRLLVLLMAVVLSFSIVGCKESVRTLQEEVKTEKSREEMPKSLSIDAVTAATPKTTEGEVVITGDLICVGCTLKEKKGAKAQCSIYDHQSGIQVEKVLFSGSWKPNAAYTGAWPPPDLPKPDPAYKGKIFFFLSNTSSAELLEEKHYGKKVIIVGKIYPDSHIIEVRFSKFAPEKKKK